VPGGLHGAVIHSGDFAGSRQLVEESFNGVGDGDRLSVW
jgi:hypothetical protein